MLIVSRFIGFKISLKGIEKLSCMFEIFSLFKVLGSNVVVACYRIVRLLCFLVLVRGLGA